MIEAIYLNEPKYKLPLYIVLAVVIGLFSLTFYLNNTYYLLILTAILLSIVWFTSNPKILSFYKRMVIVVVIVSLMTLNVNIFFKVFLKGLCYISIATLFFTLYPIKKLLRYKYSHVTLALLPYFESVVENILLSARIKGVNLKSKNPIKLIKFYVKILIPTFVSFMKVVDDLELSLKIKGGL